MLLPEIERQQRKGPICPAALSHRIITRYYSEGDTRIVEAKGRKAADDKIVTVFCRQEHHFMIRRAIFRPQILAFGVPCVGVRGSDWTRDEK
jgi:hypothetical protein